MNQNGQINIYLHQLERRLETDCHAAGMRVQRATTMAEVVRATSVSIPHELRAMRNAYAAYRRMTASAEHRMEELLLDQLAEMKALPLAEAEALFGRYRVREWQALRGTYANLFRRGEIEGHRLLHAMREASKDV